MIPVLVVQVVRALVWVVRVMVQVVRVCRSR